MHFAGQPGQHWTAEPLCQAEAPFRLLCRTRLTIAIYSLTPSWQEDGKAESTSERRNIIRAIFISSVTGAVA